MSGIPCRVEADLRNHEADLERRAKRIAPFLESAKEELADRLRDGKKVAGQDLWDLLDTELNTDRYKVIVNSIASLLFGRPDYSRDWLAEEIRDDLIERHLEAHPDEVEEMASEISEDR